MIDFIVDNPAFIICCSLFLIEQIAIYFPGAFPYQFGIPITRKLFPTDKLNQKVNFEPSGLVIKKDKFGNIYFHYKYPPIVFGPLIFVGHISCDKKDKVIIRLAPLTALFLCFLVLTPFSQDGSFHILDSFLIIILVLFFYYRFLRNFQNTVQLINS